MYKCIDLLETKWIVFFDMIGMQWEYRPKTFRFDPPIGNVTPTFWLPEHHAFLNVLPEHSIELRGVEVSNEATELVKKYGYAVFLAEGSPKIGWQGLCTVYTAEIYGELILYHNFLEKLDAKNSNTAFIIPPSHDEVVSICRNEYGACIDIEEEPYIVDGEEIGGSPIMPEIDAIGFLSLRKNIETIAIGDYKWFLSFDNKTCKPKFYLNSCDIYIPLMNKTGDIVELPKEDDATFDSFLEAYNSKLYGYTIYADKAGVERSYDCIERIFGGALEKARSVDGTERAD